MGGSRRRSDSGQSTVEFGISSIVLLLVLMGLLDLSRGFYFAVRLQDAARVGARHGAVYAAYSGTYPNLNNASIMGAVNGVLSSTGIATAGSVQGSCPTPSNGNAQYNAPYVDSAYPSASSTPWLYVCYNLGQSSAPSSPQLTDLLVVVLYRYGLTSGFLQNQAGIGSVKMVGAYHALVP